jgi:hypothetical protein
VTPVVWLVVPVTQVTPTRIAFPLLVCENVPDPEKVAL